MTLAVTVFPYIVMVTNIITIKQTNTGEVKQYLASCRNDEVIKALLYNPSHVGYRKVLKTYKTMHAFPRPLNVVRPIICWQMRKPHF